MFVLGMKHAAAKIIPNLLNFEQKQRRMDIALEMLTTFNDNLDLLTNHGCMVMTLKPKLNHPNGSVHPRPKKSRQVRSNVKDLLSVFLDCNGEVHHEFLPQDRTANKDYYIHTYIIGPYKPSARITV